MLEGKKIIYGVTGSVAAIKAPIIARELMRSGATVQTVMTPSAEKFTTAYSLSVITKNEAITNIFSSSESTWHIHLGRSADAMLIAPCSATTLGKLRYGIYDNAVLLVVSSLKSETPLVLAPAMDEEMWLQPAVQENISWLRAHGVHIIEPVSGALASGLVGMGRMSEPDELIKKFEELISSKKTSQSIEHHSHLSLINKRILITGGPTYEPIDPVRFIGNRSSGKMGAALANVAANEFGASVTLVMGPSTSETVQSVNRINVETTAHMHRSVESLAPSSDIIIMSAAVSDYKIKSYSGSKLKKNGSASDLTLELESTVDILKEISSRRNAKQIIVGFALESRANGEAYAKKKLTEKSLDMIVLNYFDEVGSGFSNDTNAVTIFTKNGKTKNIPLASKTMCAREILIAITELL